MQLPILVRDVRDAGPRRVVGTLAHTLRDPIEDKLPQVKVPVLVTRGSSEPIVPPGWAQTATQLSSALASVELRGSGVGAAGGAAELRQSSCQRHHRLPLDASIRTAAFGYVAWMAVALVRLVAAGGCPTV